ncbi:MAG: hypothetical protein U0869_10295 [Chloroflexota bacterium]
MTSDDKAATPRPDGREAFRSAPIGETPLSLQQKLLSEAAAGADRPAKGAPILEGDPATIARVREKLLAEAKGVATGIARNHTLHDWPWADAERVLSGRFPVTYAPAPDPAAALVPTIVGGHLLRFHADPGAMAELEELGLLLHLARWAGATDTDISAMTGGFRKELTERRLDRAEGRR